VTRPVLWTHRATVALIGLFVATATLDGFAQSWAGLYAWAVEHGLTGWKADAFPGLIDLFILVGELGLFALALEAHKLTGGLAWFDLAVPGVAALAGWSVSLAFNVGHVAHVWTTQVTAAAAPVASMLGLLVLLRTLHRFVTRTVAPSTATTGGQPSATEAAIRQLISANILDIDDRTRTVLGMSATVPPKHRPGWSPSHLTLVAPGTQRPAGVAEPDRPVDQPTDSDRPALASAPDPLTTVIATIRQWNSAGVGEQRIADDLGASRHWVRKVLGRDSQPAPTATNNAPVSAGSP
jgi:hypothetical protein